MSTLAVPTIMFRDILIAFDFSDASDRALQYAQAIARSHASRMLLTHVMENPTAKAPFSGWIAQDALVTAERVNATGAALREQGFAIEPLNLYGEITRQIDELIDSHSVDIIVAGTHAGQGVDRAIFGSNAEKLARSVNCPILLIGPECCDVYRCWEPQRVLVASRLYPERTGTTLYAAHLAHMHNAELKVVHVAQPDRPYNQEGWEVYIGKVSKQLPVKNLAAKAQKIISKRRAADEILQAAQDWQAEVIVMGASHGSMGITHFRRGVLGEVLAEASCPVLAIRH